MRETIIKLLRDNINLPINPYNQEGYQNGIVYNFVPLTDNKIVRTERLEIHIIASTLAEAWAIDEEVRHILLTIGDEALIEGINKVEINGGGSLEDIATGTKHIITYYYLVCNGGIKNEY